MTLLYRPGSLIDYRQSICLLFEVDNYIYLQDFPQILSVSVKMHVQTFVTSFAIIHSVVTAHHTSHLLKVVSLYILRLLLRLLPMMPTNNKSICFSSVVSRPSLPPPLPLPLLIPIIAPTENIIDATRRP
jgi:hypothetical protein